MWSRHCFNWWTGQTGQQSYDLGTDYWEASQWLCFLGTGPSWWFFWRIRSCWLLLSLRFRWPRSFLGWGSSLPAFERSAFLALLQIFLKPYSFRLQERFHEQHLSFENVDSKSPRLPSCGNFRLSFSCARYCCTRCLDFCHVELLTA